MTDVNATVLNYISAWNERDARKRREIVARTWSEDGTYIDSARHGEGQDSISEMIGVAQSHFPGYALCLSSGIEAHNDHVRFSWETVGSRETPLRLGGTDFVSLARDGRMKSVVGFVDAAPARPAR